MLIFLYVLKSFEYNKNISRNKKITRTKTQKTFQHIHHILFPMNPSQIFTTPFPTIFLTPGKETAVTPNF